jgi:hypothetical protein
VRQLMTAAFTRVGWRAPTDVPAILGTFVTSTGTLDRKAAVALAALSSRYASPGFVMLSAVAPRDLDFTRDG